MSPDSIPQISPGTAALVIFAVCAGYILLRGLTRMLIGTLVFAASLWSAFLVWQNAATLSISWTGKISALITIGLPFVTFFVAFLLIRKIAALIARPFGKSDNENDSPSLTRRVLRLPLAFIPAGFLWLTGAAIVHHIGSIAEIRASAETADGADESVTTSYIRRLKTSVQAALPAPLLRLLDPLAEPTRLDLAKLIAAQSEQPLQPVIDPATGKPIPRAIIVDDPELQNLARQRDFSTLLRHPQLTKALEDPKIQTLLQSRRAKNPEPGHQ